MGMENFPISNKMLYYFTLYYTFYKYFSPTRFSFLKERKKFLKKIKLNIKFLTEYYIINLIKINIR